MQSAELVLVHNVKSGWTDCGLHHLCPNAKIIHFMHILLEQWQYSYYVTQSKKHGVFFPPSPFTLTSCIQPVYQRIWQLSERQLQENTTPCYFVSYSNKTHHLRSPITNETSPVCAAFNTTQSLSTKEVSKMIILKAVCNDLLHAGLPTFCTLCTAQWVEWLRTDLSFRPISVPPYCYI